MPERVSPRGARPAAARRVTARGACVRGVLAGQPFEVIAQVFVLLRRVVETLPAECLEAGLEGPPGRNPG